MSENQRKAITGPSRVTVELKKGELVFEARAAKKYDGSSRLFQNSKRGQFIAR